jgi:hypothetical protein
MSNNYCILWEYDKPINSIGFLNYTSGIWQWVISPAWDGVKTILDDRGITGFYRDNNIIVYDIRSVSVDGVQYSRVFTYSELQSTESAFLYNISTTKILIHFNNSEPPHKYSEIAFGFVKGFSKGVIGDNKPYYNNIFYEPRVNKVFNISKKKDPLFYGLLKYTTGSVSCFNEDGYFDDWRDRNLYAQASRILIGEKDDAYSAFTLAFQGLIENDYRSWTEFNVKLQDPRKGLTLSIANNLLNKTLYPSLNDSNVDKPKPVKYGKQIKSPCICLNETQTGTTTFTFLLCDTEFNAVDSITTVYVDGTATATASQNLTAGTFTLTMTAGTDQANVTATFQATATKNGVDIIKDLMYRYDDKNYTSTFWDTTETAIAQAVSRDTSVSVDDDKKLQDVIQQICVDIDGVFFFKDTGVYTIRIYDDARAVTKIIYQDEWISEPEIENNGAEFLSSVIIKYNHNLDNDKYEQYENVNYKATVFDTYKTYKTTTIETNLTSLADAQAKSESIMSISKLVGDIITRSIPYCTDIEIMDFVAAAPVSRLFTKNGVAIAPVYNKYEVLGITKNFDKFEIALTLRYIEPYTMPIDETYNVLVDESGNFATDESGNTNIIRG